MAESCAACGNGKPKAVVRVYVNESVGYVGSDQEVWICTSCLKKA